MSQESERMAARAAAYLARSREETPAQRREREAWLAADRRHLEVYQRLQGWDEHAADLLGDADLQVLAERDLETVQRARRWRRRGAWAAAVLLLLLVGAYLAGAFSAV